MTGRYCTLAGEGWPLSLADLRAATPDTLWPATPDDEALAAHGFARVVTAPAPEPPHRFATLRPAAAPELVDGVWTIGWVVEEPELDDVKVALRDEVADRRWRHETGGVTVAGIAVATDDRSKLLLNGKYRTAEKNPAMLHRWKSPAGEVVLTSAEVIALGDAVSAHVQACFDRELDLVTAIDAAVTLADALAIDLDAGWPE